MLFLRSWLEEYINLDGISNEKLAQIITTKSSEVEEFTRISDYFDSKVVLGKIKNVEKHPTADKLKVFEVNCGKFKTKIVSAAPNVCENLLVAVALVGAKLPFLSVSSKKLRGIESVGLCLGKSELALETSFSAGLWELETDLENRQKLNLEKLENNLKNNSEIDLGSNSQENSQENSDKKENKLQHIEQISLDKNVEKNAKISDKNGIENQFDNLLGKSVCELFPELFPSETVFDIKVLPDKIAQIGHHLGMAIEIATVLENLDLLTAKGKKGIKFGETLEIKNSENTEITTLETQGNGKLDEKNTIESQANLISFEDNFGGTNRFDLYNLKLEKPFVLPHFLQTRMFLTGRNLVGGIVDLSNYLLADMGQPSHFFDTNKI